MSEPKKTIIEEDEIDLLQFVKVLWNRKIQIVAITLLVGVISVFFAITRPSEYESVSKWLPNQKSGGAGQLSGLAALAGVNIGGASSTDYEAYFEEVLKSPILLDSLIDKKWKISSGDSVNMMTFLEIDTAKIEVSGTYITKELILKNSLYGFFKNILEYERSPKSLSLTVTTKDPILSFEINTYLLHLLKGYTEIEKNSKAQKERLFIEGRYDDFRSDLKKAESNLKNFRENNINVSSPSLMLQQQQLIREVEIYNQLVIEFRKQLELAKIEEVKGTPEFNIIQEPTIPLTKSKPNKRLIVMVGLVLGFFIGCFFALLAGWWKENGENFKSELGS
jgi:capsular polysaccharide biosynthesis protein